MSFSRIVQDRACVFPSLSASEKYFLKNTLRWRSGSDNTPFAISLVTASLFFLALAVPSSAQEWPRFRGPNGSGVSTANIPAEWSQKDIHWKIKLPGKGHSSPVVWGKQIYVTGAEEKSGERFLACVSADNGKILWERHYGAVKQKYHQDSGPASASPAAGEKGVYITWGNAKEYLVIGLNHEGKEIWRRDLGPCKMGYGLGASPIVHEGLVIVPNDQDGKSSLFALDQNDGQIRWEVPRKSKSSYSTPCVFQPKGKAAELIFTNYEHGVSSIDPASGKLNWELDVFHKGHLQSAIGSPVVAGNLILAPCGWLSIRHEVVAVRPPSPPGNKQPERIYDLFKSAPLCTTPLVKDELLFLWSEKGVVTCASVETGKVHWQKRVAGSYYSSPVCAGNYLFNISREGDVVVLEAAPKFKQLAQNQLGEGTHATPAIAHGRMYVRTFTQLLCVGGKKAE